MKDMVIIDYGMGNIESVKNALALLGVNAVVAHDAKTIAGAQGLILPGVGAFSAAMQNLQNLKLIEVLHEQVVLQKKPFLGICLGLQLLAEDSTELGFMQGLGWISGHVVKLEISPTYPVPHVGWNEVYYRQGARLFQNIDAGAHFFFDHSYHLNCAQDVVAASCQYDVECVASIEQDNIFAVQFHPEKSQRNGLKLLRNFLNFSYESQVAHA